MDISQQIASALGFPKPAFTSVEHERRWLCREVPRERILHSEAITDLYVAGTRLRLREARPIGGGAAKLRFSRKADVDARTRLITSIYLPEEEFAVLAAPLPGVRIRKPATNCNRRRTSQYMSTSFGRTRRADHGRSRVQHCARFAAFPMPDFAVREVTDDPRFNGGHLAKNGLPETLQDGAAQK